MCPEPDILSAFADGELSASLRDLVSRHAESCDSCSDRLSAYSSLSSVFADSPVPDEEAVRLRVKTRVLMSAYTPVPLYRRSVSIPLPVAAVFLLGLVALSLAAFTSRAAQGPRTIADLPPGMAEQLAVTIKVDSMDQLVNLLASQNRFREVTIELPDAPMFAPVGEPQFLREADYRKGK